MQSFPTKNGFNHDFPLVSQCQKLLRRIFTTFHSSRKPRTQDAWFKTYRKVSAYGKKYYERNFEPMIPIFLRIQKVESKTFPEFLYLGKNKSYCFISIYQLYNIENRKTF